MKKRDATRQKIETIHENNHKTALIAEYGPGLGAINSTDMLSAMIDDTKKFERTGNLGVTVVDELCKSLAEMAYEALSQGQSITANMSFPVH